MPAYSDLPAPTRRYLDKLPNGGHRQIIARALLESGLSTRSEPAMTWAAMRAAHRIGYGNVAPTAPRLGPEAAAVIAIVDRIVDGVGVIVRP